MVGRGVVCLLAASAGPESVMRAIYGRCLTCAAPGYYSQCRSDTTSTVVKRRWHVLRMLSGAIPSTWLLAFNVQYEMAFHINHIDIGSTVGLKLANSRA